MGPDSHHPLYQQFSLGLQQEIGNEWLLSADGLHVFGERELIGNLLRTTNSTSPDIGCPGSNVACTITDPVTGISDNITLIQSGAKSWYDGLLVSVAHRESKIGKVGYQYNLSYTLSKNFDYSDDDQLTNNNADEQVNLVEGTSGLRKGKGYALTDERHRLTFYGDAQLPYGFSVVPIYTYGSGVPANTLLPSTAINGASGARLPLLPRNALGREVKNSDQLNALINKWNALPACPGAHPCNAGGVIENVPAHISFSSSFSSLDLRLRKKFSFGEHVSLSLIGEGFNLANQVNIRGSNTANFSRLRRFSLLQYHRSLCPARKLLSQLGRYTEPHPSRSRPAARHDATACRSGIGAWRLWRTTGLIRMGLLTPRTGWPPAGSIQPRHRGHRCGRGCLLALSLRHRRIPERQLEHHRRRPAGQDSSRCRHRRHLPSGWSGAQP